MGGRVSLRRQDLAQIVGAGCGILQNGQPGPQIRILRDPVEIGQQAERVMDVARGVLLPDAFLGEQVFGRCVQPALGELPHLAAGRRCRAGCR